MQTIRKVLVLSAILWIWPAAFSQVKEIKIDLGADVEPHLPGYHLFWDSVQDLLILYRNADIASTPAVRIVRDSGASVPIYPLRDLPEARSLTVWSVASAPGAGAVLSATVNYSPLGVMPPVLKSLLLTYDGSGNLKKVWDVYPFEHDHLAVDKDGNVFAMGTRNTNKRDYAQIVKYSPEAKVVREFLAANTFPEGEKVALPGPSGESQMFIHGDVLFLWLASELQLLRFSLSGDLLGRLSLKPQLTTVADDTRSGLVQVRKLAITQGQDLVLQVVLWPNDKKRGARFAMLRFSAQGMQIGSAGSLSDIPIPGRFLGTTGNGKLVFLENARPEGIGTIRIY